LRADESSRALEPRISLWSPRTNRAGSSWWSRRTNRASSSLWSHRTNRAGSSLWSHRTNRARSSARSRRTRRTNRSGRTLEIPGDRNFAVPAINRRIDLAQFATVPLVTSVDRIVILSVDPRRPVEQHEQRDQRTSEVIGRPFHFLELLLLISVITFCIPLGRIGAGARIFKSSQASLELV